MAKKNQYNVKNPNWKGGLPYCKICNKQLSSRHSKNQLCIGCFNLKRKKENHPLWKGGDKSRECFCIDCNKKLSKLAYYYNNKRCKSCAMKEIRKNPKNHPMYNKKGELSANWRGGKTLIKYYCIDCGKKLSKGVQYRGITKCHSCAVKGKNHPNFKDGSSLEDYPSEFNQELKESIRKRDNCICRNCGMTEEEHLIVYGTLLNIHHIDYDKNNLKNYNLITLCRGCNLRANYNRDYWKDFYKQKIIKEVTND